MRKLINKLKNKLGGSSTDYDEPDTHHEDYIAIDSDAALKKPQTKVSVRPFVLENFEDVKPILDALREGYTIVLVNIKPLKDRDLVELKRAVAKIKKTCEAVDGDVAGFGNDWIAATPSFATIYRAGSVSSEPSEELKRF